MTVTHSPSSALLPTVAKLLMLRWRINLNSFRHAQRRTQVFTVIGVVLLAAFVAFLFWLSWFVLGIISSPKLVIYTGINSAPLMDAMPVTIFTGMFIGILFTSFGVLLQALYLSGDMDFLMVAPVSLRAVFFAKLLQAVLPNFIFMGFFGLPLLFGMGMVRGYNFLYYPLVIIVMVTLTLAAAGLSSLLVMLVARVFPARRVAEVLGFLGAILSILCSQSGNLMSFRSASAMPTTTQMNSLMSLQTSLNTPWFPLNWVGRGLVELGSGNWLSGILLVSLTLLLFGGIFWFALVTAERWYYTGWASMQMVSRKKRAVSAPPPATTPRGTGFTLLERFLPAPTRGIIQKDFLVLRRDLRNLSQLVTPLIFGVIYAAAFLRDTGRVASGDVDVFLRPLFAFANVGVALFVGWNLLIRLGGMAFSMEGKTYWLIKAAPLRASHLLTAKFLVAYLPALSMGTLFMLAISVIQQLSLVSFFYGLLMTVFCLAEMTGIMVAFGVAGANLDWDDPRKMTSGVFGCFGILSTVLYTGITYGLFVLPLMLVPLLRLPEMYGYLAGFACGGVFGLGGALLPLLLVRKKVERLGEA